MLNSDSGGVDAAHSGRSISITLALGAILAMSIPPESGLRPLAVRAVRLPYDKTDTLTEDEVGILTHQAIAGAAHHVNRAQLYLAELIDITRNDDIKKHIADMERVRRFLADLPAWFRL